MNTLDEADLLAAGADEATRQGAQAFARLLQLAEERNSGPIARIAISNDMLCCLDALRWGRVDLHRLVPDGDRRARTVIDRWGLRWPDDA